MSCPNIDGGGPCQQVYVEQVGTVRSTLRRQALGLNPPDSRQLEVPDGAAVRCPLLAVRRRLRGAAAEGWSLVLPAQWVMPVWQALTFAGARAVGLREWRWAATDQVPSCADVNPAACWLCVCDKS